jgi:hypothetical protein
MKCSSPERTQYLHERFTLTTLWSKVIAGFSKSDHIPKPNLIANIILVRKAITELMQERSFYRVYEAGVVEFDLFYGCWGIARLLILSDNSFFTLLCSDFFEKDGVYNSTWPRVTELLQTFLVTPLSFCILNY